MEKKTEYQGSKIYITLVSSINGLSRHKAELQLEFLVGLGG
jgi:hypothetical protein